MDPEELYPPKPGGMVDTARKQAAAQAVEVPDAEVTPPDGYPAVRVRPESAEVFGGQTFLIGTGANLTPIRQILGLDPNRRRATIITLDQPVVLAGSRANAESPANATTGVGLPAGGFVLPVNVPVWVEARGVLFAAATAATATRVCVLPEMYAPGAG